MHILDQSQARRQPYLMLDHIPSKHKESFTEWLKTRSSKGNGELLSANLFDYVAWKSLYDKGLITPPEGQL